MGKTTLACNIAAFLAEEAKLNIVVVDADPQCNATQLILPEELTEQLYESGKAPFGSLKQVLHPVSAGDASIDTSIAVATAGTNRFGVAIVPGHPQISLLEDTLSQRWTAFLGGDLGGARVSNWNTQLVEHLSKNYDVIIYDVGPSLGALNRSILIGVDYFVSPMGCDIFSLIGIKNISEWVQRWRADYQGCYQRCLQLNASDIGKYTIKPSSEKMSRFLGYTVQQYITKTIRDEKRATGAYETILKQIPGEVESSLGSVRAEGLVSSDMHIGDVPHMYSLVPLAQTAHVPIHKLTGKDGLAGGQYTQQAAYLEFLTPLCASILHNLKKAGSLA